MHTQILEDLSDEEFTQPHISYTDSTFALKQILSKRYYTRRNTLAKDPLRTKKKSLSGVKSFIKGHPGWGRETPAYLQLQCGHSSFRVLKSGEKKNKQFNDQVIARHGRVICVSYD